MSTDLSIILKVVAQNEASPVLEKVTASLKETGAAARALTGDFNAMAGSITRLNEGLAKLDTGLLRLPGRLSDVSAVARTQVTEIDRLAAAYGRLATEQGRAHGNVGGTVTGGGGTSESSGRGGGGFGLGSMLAQGAVFGGGYLALSGIRSSVTQAVDFNATAASTQATTGISSGGLRQVTDGIMQIAGSGNSRYDANTLLQGAYAIISTGVTNPQQVLSQLKAAAASATAANATDVLPSTSALTTVMNAYGASTGAMKYQDIISMAINQGKADPSQVPAAFATFARSAKTAGISAKDAGGFFAFDTLASRDAQTSGQDMDALFRLVNNPDQASRTFAKKLPGLDWGTGMVGRAGGLDKWVQNLLNSTAGPNQGLLLSHLVNNAPALAAIEGAAADPSKLHQYLADAGGTGKTVGGAKTFMDSDAGKLYGATNELKTEFQKFSNSAVPLLTDAVKTGTAALQMLGSVGNTLDDLARQLNIPGHTTSLALGAMQAVGIGTVAMGQLVGKASNPRHADAPNALLTSIMGVVMGNPNVQSALNDAASFVNDAGGGLGGGSRRRGGGTVPSIADTGGLFTMGGPLAGAIGGASASVTNAIQANAVAFAQRTSGQKKTADMASAQAALSMALATGASSSVINQALYAYVNAVHGSGMDAASAAYAVYQARASVDAYNQGIAATAANTANTQTQTGYAHVQAVLSNAQFSHSGVAAATASEISFLRAHPSLWGGDPAILQNMINGIQGSAASATVHAATGPNLVRQSVLGLGALQSGAMNTAALYGHQGGSLESKHERNLEAQLAAIKEQLKETQAALRVAQDQLGVARDSYKVLKEVAHYVAPTGKPGTGGHARGPLVAHA